MYDFHIHSKNSPDSTQTFDEICASAIEKGLEGVAVCDHADIPNFVEDNTLERIKGSISENEEASMKFNIKIFKGLELGESFLDKEKTDSVLSLCDYDVILASIHSIRNENSVRSFYSRVDFSEGKFSKNEIIACLNRYFDDLLTTVNQTDFDILCHLTCPFRYINGKYNRNIDEMLFAEKIEQILKTLIEKGKSLEVNTSGVNTAYNNGLMPSKNILKMYYDFGGRKISIGSDAHTAAYIANGFKETMKLLKKIGFEEYLIFEKRKPKAIKL